MRLLRHSRPMVMGGPGSSSPTVCDQASVGRSGFGSSMPTPRRGSRHVASGRPAAELSHAAGVRLQRRRCPDDRRHRVGPSTVWLMDPERGATSITSLTPGLTTVAAGATNDSRLLLLTASNDGARVQVWDPQSGATVGKPVPLTPNDIEAVSFGAVPDGRTLLATIETRTAPNLPGVRLWDLDSGICRAAIQRKGRGECRGIPRFSTGHRRRRGRGHDRGSHGGTSCDIVTSGVLRGAPILPSQPSRRPPVRHYHSAKVVVC